MKLTHALIIPGFGGMESGYLQIENDFRSVGITPKFVPITWPRTVLTQQLAEFRKVYDKYDPVATVIFGYSVGGMIALLAAAGRNPAVLILTSIAPWFAEDIPMRSESHKQLIGHRRLAVYKETKFDEIARHITAETYIYTSEGEGRRWPAYTARAKDAHQKIAGSTLIEVPRAGHDISLPEYRQVLQELITSLHPE